WVTLSSAAARDMERCRAAASNARKGLRGGSRLAMVRKLLYRQRMRALHFTEREARLDRGDAVEPGQLLLEEALIGFEIAHHNAHEIVALPGHQETVDDLRPACDRLGETVELFLALALQLDRGEDADWQADFRGVDDGGIALDDFGLLQIAHAPCARR